MKSRSLLLLLVLLTSLAAFAQTATQPALIQPQELALILQSGKAKPLIR